MPRQDSTTDQLESVAEEAKRYGLLEAVIWLNAWNDDYKRSLNPQAFQLLCKIAVQLGCYDAHDAMRMRYYGRLN
jgi:hypothetical protein